ncbi:zinc finger protein 878-like [Anopheles ziemanni]|uniref:zinc finger protein 878-like n=1 Tax=Anopheles coustani TaxID=139045 RepID=UPI0026590C0F|nr:zinc finger protein 878-like [Anopheles coustani]XP_058172296.1 zinc finger protein 878-like [Anopheles ziemanni]
MGRKCCVPDCFSNYDAALKTGAAAASTFQFPNDPALYNRWLQAIRRPNWVPSKRSSVCMHHFKPDDIMRYDKPAKLQPGAVPCLFGESILRSAVRPKRGRRRKDLQLTENETNADNMGNDLSAIYSADHVIGDCILNFANFKRYVREKLQHSEWMILERVQVVHLFYLDDSDDQCPIRIDNSIKVYSDLKIKLYTREEEQSDKQLQWILGMDNKLMRWSQLITIVDKYGDASRYASQIGHDQQHTELSLGGEQCELSLIEEHLDNMGEEKGMIESVENAADDTTNQCTVHDESVHEADSNFVDIGGNDSVESENSLDGDIKCNKNGSRESFISKLKPILSQVRELQRAKFKCFVCNIDQGTQEEYERHMPTHLAMLPYHCTICTKDKVTIKTLASLNKHCLMHCKPLKCRFCDVRFTTYASRVLHEDTKHKSTATTRCDVCQKVFSSLRSYQYHRKIHDDPETLKCKICNRILSSRYELKLHMRTHTGEKPNKCTFCTVSFNRRSNLVQHIRRFHSMERPYDCAVCGDRFRTNFVLKRHLKSHDAITDSDASKPKRVSRSSKVLQCADCDRQFLSHVSYHSHRRQHDKRYQCSYCGIRIAQLRDFEDHENIHTGTRPYECKTCGKKFRSSSTYYSHLRVHGGEKKHFCEICNKGFLRPYHLQVHMRMHTGEKQFRCNTCGRTYSVKAAYKRHQLTHRPTVADMLCAQGAIKGIVSSVPDKTTFPPSGVEGNETFVTSISAQMGIVFSSEQVLPAVEDGIGALPSVMSSVLNSECPVVFECLSEGSYMTELPQMITSDDPTITSIDLK